MRKDQRVTYWWLERGTEICPVCHHVYIYETEYRCSDCDGPVCADCVKNRELNIFVCSPCFDLGEGSIEVELEV